MASVSGRNITRNQATFDYTREGLLIHGWETITAGYANILGSEETLEDGQLMGMVAATGKWVPCKSGASDGSAIPRAVLITGFTAATGATRNVTLVNYGRINKNKVVLDGTDTFATLVGGIRMDALLIANSQGLILEDVSDNSEFDN
jgi:hypothetical protein